jgi:serine/threonine protein kinase
LKVDVWALGVLFCDMIGRFTPFYDQNPIKMYQNILLGRIKWPKNMGKVAKDLAQKMLTTDPNMRISLEDIKKHLFFKDIDWKKAKDKQLDPFYVPELQGQYDYSKFVNKLTEKEVDRINSCDSPMTITEYLENQPETGKAFNKFPLKDTNTAFDLLKDF